MRTIKYELDGRRYLGIVDGEMRIVELPTEYLACLENSSRKYATGTIENYARSVRDFSTYLESRVAKQGERVDGLFPDLTLTHVDRFLASLDVEASTARRTEAALRSFTDWLASFESGRVLSKQLFDETVGPRTASPKQKLPKFLFSNDVIQLILGCKFEAQRIAIHALFDTGMRESEFAGFQFNRLPDLAKFPLDQHYFEILVDGGKGRGRKIKQRKTIITRALVERIYRYHNNPSIRFSKKNGPGTGPAFINVFGDPWNEKSVQAMVRRAAIRAKVTCHPHLLRHSFALSILQSDSATRFDEKLVLVQRYLGHEKIETTQKYYLRAAPAVMDRALGSASTSIKRFLTSQEIVERTEMRIKDQPVARRILRK